MAQKTPVSRRGFFAGASAGLAGQVIPGLYCGGETAGGFSEHGLARATCQGFIAGRHAMGV